MKAAYIKQIVSSGNWIAFTEKPFSIMPSSYIEGCYKIHLYETYCCKDYRDIVEDAIHHISVYALGSSLRRVSIRFPYLIYFYLINWLPEKSQLNL